GLGHSHVTTLLPESPHRVGAAWPANATRDKRRSSQGGFGSTRSRLTRSAWRPVSGPVKRGIISSAALLLLAACIPRGDRGLPPPRPGARAPAPTSATMRQCLNDLGR